MITLLEYVGKHAETSLYSDVRIGSSGFNLHSQCEWLSDQNSINLANSGGLLDTQGMKLQLRVAHAGLFRPNAVPTQALDAGRWFVGQAGNGPTDSGRPLAVGDQPRNFVVAGH